MPSKTGGTTRENGSLAPAQGADRAPPRRRGRDLDGVEAAESITLAREFTVAHRGMIDCLRQVYEKDDKTALAEATEYPASLKAQALNGDPAEVSWHDLDRLAAADPQLALRRWREIKSSAMKDLLSGHRAARALEPFHEGRPWQRAEFIGLRTALAEEWQPRGGMEWHLIDKLAQASTEEEQWLQQAVSRRTLQWQESGRKGRETGRHEAPRMDFAASTEQAMAMADRWNRIFCRTLRALRDLRRYAVSVNIQGPGQVNIGMPPPVAPRRVPHD